MGKNLLIEPRLLEFEDESMSIEDLHAMSVRASDQLARVRGVVTAPDDVKIAPIFPIGTVVQLCGVDRTRFKYLIQRGDLPEGTPTGDRRARHFSLKEAIECIQITSERPKRPDDLRGRVLSVANFKGGVAKTTTSVSLAQALTLLGRRVLLIDCDPQGSTTHLLGVPPETDVGEADTIMPYLDGQHEDLRYAVRQTYWHNLDLIPAATLQYEAEFKIPALVLEARMQGITGYPFWDLLKEGILPLMNNYDVAIFDTAPALSYVTLNALMASDGIIMPCPPEGLDFASSTQFWNLFSDISGRLPGISESKRFDFVKVLPTKTNKNDLRSQAVTNWMREAYGVRVLPIEIPESAVPKSASARMRTVYDEPTAAANRFFKEPMDRLADHVDSQLVRAWARAQAQAHKENAQ